MARLSSINSEPAVAAQVPEVDDSASAGGVQVNFSANMGGPYEEVTTVGGPNVIVDHEVDREANGEVGVADEP